jgi:release factor glutamine methyltransferase
MTTVAQLLARASELAAVSDSAALDGELLLCHCLGKNRAWLRAWSDKVVTSEQLAQFDALMARRRQGEPVAYILGERGFWSLDLAVSPATLIPRPETELLVERTLALLADCPRAQVLDLGTGTGAIALALAAEQPQWQILACDVQPEAVALAKANCQRLGFSHVAIQQSSWFDAIAPQRFDAIVSNPPYIDGDDPHLSQGDVRFEPRSALVADNHGLADIEHIAASAGSFLKPGGYLLLEHGFEQGAAVRQILSAAGFNHDVTEQDLAGLDRMTLGQWQGDSDE